MRSILTGCMWAVLVSVWPAIATADPISIPFGLPISVIDQRSVEIEFRGANIPNILERRSLSDSLELSIDVFGGAPPRTSIVAGTANLASAAITYPSALSPCPHSIPCTTIRLLAAGMATAQTVGVASNLEFAKATSSFQVQLRLHEWYLLVLLGTFGSTGRPPEAGREATWTIDLLHRPTGGNFTSLIAEHSGPGLDETFVLHSPLLGPGLYDFRVEANAFSRLLGDSATANAHYAFTFDLVPADPDPSPVPEPGSLALISTGLVAAMGALRRRRNRTMP